MKNKAIILALILVLALIIAPLSAMSFSFKDRVVYAYQNYYASSAGTTKMGAPATLQLRPSGLGSNISSLRQIWAITGAGQFSGDGGYPDAYNYSGYAEIDTISIGLGADMQIVEYGGRVSWNYDVGSNTVTYLFDISEISGGSGFDLREISPNTLASTSTIGRTFNITYKNEMGYGYQLSKVVSTWHNVSSGYYSASHGPSGLSPAFLSTNFGSLDYRTWDCPYIYYDYNGYAEVEIDTSENYPDTITISQPPSSAGIMYEISDLTGTAVIPKDDTLSMSPLNISVWKNPYKLTTWDILGRTHEYTLGAFQDWQVIVTDREISLGESTTGKILAPNGDYSQVRYLLWYLNDESTTDFRNIAIFRYNTSTTWDKHNDSGWYYGKTLSPFELTIKPAYIGNKTVRCLAYTTGMAPLGAGEDYLNVTTLTGITTVPMHLGAINGLNNNHLYDFNLALKNLVTNVWTNYTNVEYEKVENLMVGVDFRLYATKDGYVSNYVDFSVPELFDTYSNYVNVPLYPTTWSTTTNSTLVVTVNELGNYYPIGGATVHLSNGQTGNTAQDGSAVYFSIPYNSSGTAAASKEGYCSGEAYYSVTTEAYKYIWISLKKGSCQETITRTPTVTLTPTVTPSGGVVVNGTVCKYPSNMWDALTFALCSTGAPTSSLGFILGFFLVFIMALIAGIVTRSGFGFLAGGILGFLTGTFAGLFPLWILFVMILLGVLGLIVLGRTAGG